jgi:hypothetical protein
MIGRRAAIGLSLLSVLMFCALAVQSASAAESKNTTAVTCVAKAESEFEDAHCDNKVKVAKTGSFEHVAIANGTETEIHITNEKTAENTTKPTTGTLKGILGGVELKIECTKVVTDPTNKSFIRNTDVAATKEHKVDGTAAVIFEGCTVNKPANCSIKSITTSSKFVGVDGLGPEKNTMGLEFKPDVGLNFASFTLEGEKCALKGKAIEVKGTAIATGQPNPKEKWTGATIKFEPGNEMQKLEIGEKPAEFSATFTSNMVNAKGETESPIALTTTT